MIYLLGIDSLLPHRREPADSGTTRGTTEVGRLRCVYAGAKERGKEFLRILSVAFGTPQTGTILANRLPNLELLPAVSALILVDRHSSPSFL